MIEKLEEVRKKILSSIVNIHFIGDPAKLPEKDWLEQNWNFLSNQAEKMEFEVKLIDFKNQQILEFFSFSTSLILNKIGK